MKGDLNATSVKVNFMGTFREGSLLLQLEHDLIHYVRLI